MDDHDDEAEVGHHHHQGLDNDVGQDGLTCIGHSDEIHFTSNELSIRSCPDEQHQLDLTTREIAEEFPLDDGYTAFIKELPDKTRTMSNPVPVKETLHLELSSNMDEQLDIEHDRLRTTTSSSSLEGSGDHCVLANSSENSTVDDSSDTEEDDDEPTTTTSTSSSSSSSPTESDSECSFEFHDLRDTMVFTSSNAKSPQVGDQSWSSNADESGRLDWNKFPSYFLEENDQDAPLKSSFQEQISQNRALRPRNFSPIEEERGDSSASSPSSDLVYQQEWSFPSNCKERQLMDTEELMVNLSHDPDLQQLVLGAELRVSQLDHQCQNIRQLDALASEISVQIIRTAISDRLRRLVSFVDRIINRAFKEAFNDCINDDDVLRRHQKRSTANISKHGVQLGKLQIEKLRTSEAAAAAADHCGHHRHAYVTMAKTDAEAIGCLMLGHSLNQTSSADCEATRKDFVALVSNSISQCLRYR